MKSIFRIFVLCLMAIGLAGCWGSYSWNQKLTVTVETPDGIKSGSAVTEIEWQKNSFFKDGPQYHASFRGEAVVVDLGANKYLFALLGNGEDSEYIADLATRVLKNTTNRVWGDDVFGQVIALKGAVEVPEIVYPMLVTFNDVNDPISVKEVKPRDLAATFGPGYVLKSITLEITEEGTSSGIAQRVLPWLTRLGSHRLDGNRYADVTAANRLANSLAAGFFSTEIAKCASLKTHSSYPYLQWIRIVGAMVKLSRIWNYGDNYGDSAIN